MGSAEMGFALGFNEHLIDDSYLGYYSGKRPDFIVVDEIYATSFRGSAVERPAVYDHINRLLTEQYRLVYDQGLYRIHAVADKPLAMQINEPTPIR
jgi:hypothetical protein